MKARCERESTRLLLGLLPPCLAGLLSLLGMLPVHAQNAVTGPATAFCAWTGSMPKSDSRPARHGGKRPKSKRVLSLSQRAFMGRRLALRQGPVAQSRRGKRHGRYGD